MAKEATDKKKSKTDTENAFDGPEGGTPRKTFQRTKAVTVPVLKVPENGRVYIRVLEEIMEKETTEKVKEKDVSGREVEVERTKTICTMRVQDLERDDALAQFQIVTGVVLARELKDFNGGNKYYVGKCFEITKRPAPEGKRAKRYEVYEIADPDNE